ncbi:AsmA family protein [Acidobacteriota bacterium]
MKKKIVLVLGVAAAVLVLAVVILFFVVDADSFRGFIETRAEETLGRDVRLGKIGLSLVPVFGLQVDDVAVAARPGEGDGDLLSLRSLRIGARLVPLLQKRLEVTSIVLVEPSINLVRGADGAWNFDLGADSDASEEQGQTAEPGAVPEVTIDAISVTGGRLSLRDASRNPSQPLEVELTDLGLEISGFGGDTFRLAVEGGKLDVADAAIGPDPLHLELGDIDLVVSSGGRSMEIERFELAVGKTTVALSGAIESLTEGMKIDIDLEPTRIEVADLSSLLESASGDLGLTLAGRRPVEVEAAVHGVLAENRLPEINAVVRFDDVAIEAETLTQPVTDVSAVVTLQGTALVVDGLRGQVGDSDFAGSLRFAVRKRPLLEFAIESRRADIGELLALVGGEEEATEEAVPPDPDSFVVRGLATGSLKVAEGSWVNLHFRDLDARMRLENGIATFEPVSMELYDGQFTGRLASDLKRVPPSFEFSGEAENIDMDPFVTDQMGMSGILMGRFTGRVAGQGAGTDPAAVIQSLEGEGVARVVDGQVGKLDVLRTVGQVAGVLGQHTLARLADESVTGATKFSQLAGDFHIGNGSLALDSVLLQSVAFDLAGAGTVDLVSSALDGDFQIQFSPEVSSWMRQESSRAAELFWDAGSGRIVLPLGLNGPFDAARATVDWNAAMGDVARRTIERELGDVLGNLLGSSGQPGPPAEAASSPAGSAGDQVEKAPSAEVAGERRAESTSGNFVLEVTRTRWGGSFLAQDFKIQCRVAGTGVERVVMTAVDAGGREVQKKTVDLTQTEEDAFEVRVDGKRLLLAEDPVTVTLVATGADGETAVVEVVVAD